MHRIAGLLIVLALPLTACASKTDLKAPCSPSDGLRAYAPVEGDLCGPMRKLDQGVPPALRAVLDATEPGG